ncbi:PREDICTED: uncharacterized protein LOC101306387 [Fragaria vesca subsp. vesca]|uniref:uncharacterized protein LOC101306387 n=1 Tax=Fragaria vesca subsp. vesca TaxID=101020 RepID=UPI0002C328B7|nr:PREDICTED: uncharacterized protein LOC101306387 [Fragaria vesca subsp. vesca]
MEVGVKARSSGGALGLTAGKPKILGWTDGGSGQVFARPTARTGPGLKPNKPLLSAPKLKGPKIKSKHIYITFVLNLRSFLLFLILFDRTHRSAVCCYCTPAAAAHQLLLHTRSPAATACTTPSGILPSLSLCSLRRKSGCYMAPIRKYPSGAKKRKEKQRREALKKLQAGSICNYLKSSITQTQTSTDENENAEASPSLNVGPDLDEEQGLNEESNLNEEPILHHHVNDSGRGEEPDMQVNEDDMIVVEDDQQDAEFNFPFDIDDPGNWGDIKQNFRDFLVERGPKRENNFTYPADDLGRRFSSAQYFRIFPNGEKRNRRWLVYSVSLDKVFCFCCKLFKQDHNKNILGKLANEGLSDWRNMGQKHAGHEKNGHHIKCFTSWIELETRLKKKATIDQALEEEIKKEKEHWQQVLLRILLVVKRLAENNLAFRRESEKLYEEKNEIFLQVIEMIAEFDPVMQAHVPRISNKETHYHYLSHKIQNEMIQLLANEIKTSIVATVKEAVYFSVILDCTPDASHEEQMSLIVRCVDVTSSPIVVREFFLGFLKVDDTSGLGLFNELTNALHTH